MERAAWVNCLSTTHYSKAKQTEIKVSYQGQNLGTVWSNNILYDINRNGLQNDKLLVCVSTLSTVTAHLHDWLETIQNKLMHLFISMLRTEKLTENS